MHTRIEQLLKSLAISPSQFADEVKVQRSSVSHVLSGRNKPSLDFITKIIKRYPEINTDWLLSGRGAMFAEETDSRKEPEAVQGSLSLEANDPGKETARDDEKRPHYTTDAELKRIERGKAPSGHGTVEKIVFFYSDGHFREYTP